MGLVVLKKKICIFYSNLKFAYPYVGVGICGKQQERAKSLREREKWELVITFNNHASFFFSLLSNPFFHFPPFYAPLPLLTFFPLLHDSLWPTH